MHQPLPYGRLAVGSAPTEQDSAALELLARRLTNLRQLSGVPSLRMVKTLPDGGYAIAQNIGGTFRVITHKPPPIIDGEQLQLREGDIPMLFSGAVVDPIVRENEGVMLRLSEGTRQRLSNYGDGGPVAAKEIRLMRFKIPYNIGVFELGPKIETVLFHSQYANQKPTWYSGAMAEVMQIVGGYGRQDFNALPDDAIERAKMTIPKDVTKKILKEIQDHAIPGYLGFPPTNGQFQYDYKFSYTHGVSFGTDNKPWLIRVNASGVWAMPLPMIPPTTTSAFREYIEEKNDREIISILDRFGGMPSGEAFNFTEEGLFAWKRAGVVIKICDVGDFYDHISYSTACGWSFNSRGTEAFNTCYNYVPDSGLGYGLAYKLKISIGARQYDMLPKSDFSGSDGDMKDVAEYLSGLNKLLRGNSAKNLAIKYKLRRVSFSELLSRARSSSSVTNEDVDYWDNLELAPIALCSGNVAVVGRGWLFDTTQPEIKFPEPFMDGCVSHVFMPILPDGNASAYTANPNADTIMFGYYVEDQLKVVKFFREVRMVPPKIEGEFEECMLVGSWTKSSTREGSLAGKFYTTDFDDRAELPGGSTTTTISSAPIGIDDPPNFSFDDLFSRPGVIWRNHYFLRKTSFKSSEGHSLEIAICIPYWCRNQILQATRSMTISSFSSEGESVVPIADPISYRYWTHDNIFAWIGGLDDMSQKPYPKDGSPVWVVEPVENATGCSAEVGGGQWIQVPADYTWLIHPKQGEWLHSGGGSPPKTKPTSSSSTSEVERDGDLKTDIPGSPEIISQGEPAAATFFLPSPDPSGTVFYTSACKVVFGDTFYANSTEKGKKWGGSSLISNNGGLHFIGVIHE